jgi:hypothetical protein
MTIDGGTVLWAFGICVACIGGLVKLAYNQIDKRVDSMEKTAHEDRKANNEAITNLYREIKDAQNRNSAVNDKLLAAILEVQLGVSSVKEALASHPIDCLERFATKKELEMAVQHKLK